MTVGRRKKRGTIGEDGAAAEGERWTDDDKISILVCVFLFYTCPVKGRNYYWPHGVTCSFFLIEKDLQLEGVSCAF